MGSALVSPAALMDQIAAGTAPVVLDVRSQREFEDGHVPGAIHLPFWRAASGWRALADVREQPIVVYCGHGPRARMAGAALKGRGFTQVTYLKGHMKAWNAMGLPLQRKTGER